MWDLFISHASEDKPTLVRPLAQTLMRRGIAVWYDEFTLKAGDSLSASIDKGLHESSFGLVIISPDFMKKNWPEYEFRSLIVKQVELGHKKMIIPVWHNVSKEEVQAKNYYIGDIIALSSKDGVENLAEKILEIVRPDIVSMNHFKAAFDSLVQNAKHETKKPESLKISPVRHEFLPKHMIPGIKMISSVFPTVSFSDTLTNFARDLFYDEEYIIWSIMACSYIETMRHYNLSLSDDELSTKLLTALIMLSSGDVDSLQALEMNEEIKLYIANAYLQNSIALKALKNVPHGDTSVHISRIITQS